MKYNMRYLGYSHYTYWEALSDLKSGISIFRRRLSFELYCFYLAFVPHHRNHYLRKVLAVILVLLWSTMTYGIAAGWIESTTMYGMLSAFVWSLVGRMWGIEIQEFSLTSGEEE